MSLATETTKSVQNVLLIDDDPSCNFILSEFISLANENVLKQECYSVDEAFEYLRTTTSFPDIIFLDLNMPVKSGFDFLESYETEFFKNYSRTKIIVLTSSLRPSDKDQTSFFQCVSSFYSKSEIDQFIFQVIDSKS